MSVRSPVERPTRRRFLRRLLMALGGAVLGGSGLAALRAGRIDAAGKHLVRRLGAGGLAARLGRAYLELHPEEARAEALATLLYRALDAPLRLASAAALRRRLAARVQLDFVEDEVVELRGWFLSRTEARLAALGALHAGPPGIG
jgi:hypothetical protein